MAGSKNETELILRELMRGREEDVIKIALAARKAVLKGVSPAIEKQRERIGQTAAVANVRLR